MIEFILNDRLIKTAEPAGSTVLDFVRYHKNLCGTKIGCREGDCGACTILVGNMENDRLVYQNMTSCLMPLANAQGKHIVTVEGINLPAGGHGLQKLSPVQQAMVDTQGTQCGFCTIGFVMSLTGFVMNESAGSYDEAIKSIDGNICRCTGYKSIERAAKLIVERTADKPSGSALNWLAENQFIPGYFTGIAERLSAISKTEELLAINKDAVTIGGGTDLIVQKHAFVKKSTTNNLFDAKELKGIREETGICYLGASVTVTDFAASPIIRRIFPKIDQYIKLVSSTPIRNMATLAGNLVNASPIGDMTAFMLALDASIILRNNSDKRTLKLKDFYKGYKQLDKSPGEFIEQIFFSIPAPEAVFNFEKVSKRTHLDIASVNCACLLQINEDGIIEAMHLSAGGVAPFPKYPDKTVAFLVNKKLTAEVLKEAIGIMNEEVAPISDARGTADYKRLLLRQLFLAHFASNGELINKTLSITV